MKKEIKEKNRRNFKKFSAIIKLVLLAVILIGIPLYIYFFKHDALVHFSSIENVREWLANYKTESILVLLGSQVLQIIICIIPGQALQFAAGLMYGFWFGYLVSIIGAAIGSTIVYYISRFLGHDAIYILFGERKVTEIIDKMNSRRGIIITFFIFLVPGLPKDFCSYAAGLSNVKLKPYLLVSLIGRTPGMMGSLIIGRQIGEGSYVSAAVIAGIACVLLILCIIFRKQLSELSNKATDKLLKM